MTGIVSDLLCTLVFFLVLARNYRMTRLLPDQLYTDEVPDGYKTDVPTAAKVKPRHVSGAGAPVRAISDVEVQSSLNLEHQRKVKKRVVRLSDVKAIQDYHSRGVHFNNLSRLRDPLQRNVTLDIVETRSHRDLAKSPMINVKSHDSPPTHLLWTTEHRSMIDLVDSGRESGSPPRHSCFSDGEGAEMKNFGFILGPGFTQRTKIAKIKNGPKSKALPLLAQIVKPLIQPLSKSSSDLRAPSSIGSVSKWAEILHNNQIIFCGTAANVGGKTASNYEHHHQRDSSLPRKPLARAATDIDLGKSTASLSVRHDSQGDRILVFIHMSSVVSCSAILGILEKRSAPPVCAGPSVAMS